MKHYYFLSWGILLKHFVCSFCARICDTFSSQRFSWWFCQRDALKEMMSSTAFEEFIEYIRSFSSTCRFILKKKPLVLTYFDQGSSWSVIVWGVTLSVFHLIISYCDLVLVSSCQSEELEHFSAFRAIEVSDWQFCQVDIISLLWLSIIKTP